MKGKTVKKSTFLTVFFLIIVLFTAPVIALTSLNPVSIIAAAENSEKSIKISLPESLKYDFFDIDIKNFELYDQLNVNCRDENGRSYKSIRSYYLNEYTGEELIASYRSDDGSFIKGYYINGRQRCTYYSDGDMTMTGSEIGKVYRFRKSKLKNVSVLSGYDGIYGCVYVTTYYGADGKRIAVKTEPSAMTGNVKIKKTLYEKYYNSFMFPISEEKFRLLTD